MLLAGLAVGITALLIGIRSSGVPVRYFFQPTGAAIVIGGTIGVALVTSSRNALRNSLGRLIHLLVVNDPDPAIIVEEIVQYARIARRGGILALEPLLPNVANPFLKDALQLAMDVNNYEELQSVMETRVRVEERQGQADARTFEVAGGYAPTIGIIGTVVGLIEVLRQFSNVQSVGYGIGTAFVSTIYGLALANFVLLPAGQRIRARVAETSEIQEMILEGMLAIASSAHPALIRMRLDSFIRSRRASDAT